MIKMFNIKKLKKVFAEQGFKISKEVVLEFIKLEEVRVLRDMEKVVRNARLRGSRVVKNRDFS